MHTCMQGTSDAGGSGDAAPRPPFGELVALALAAPAAAVRIAGVLQGRGFWNDEAWLAIATRVHGVGDFLLALSVTPLGWGALLRPFAALPIAPEIALRLLPLAFGLATLLLAWRLGNRLADTPAGGLVALALVGADPTSIGWSMQLKPYTADAALTLLAFLAADDVARSARREAVVRLALLLAVGATLSNAQLLIAPALLGTLAVRALGRGEHAQVRALVLATTAVGLFDLAWFAIAIRPWLTPGLHEYFQPLYAPTTDAHALVSFVRVSLMRILGPGLGWQGLWLALAGIGVLLATPASWAACAVLVLFAELVAASAMELVPFGVLRTDLYLSTLLLVTTGAAVGRVAVGFWRRPSTRVVALAVAASFALVVARSHPPVRSQVPVGEELGPLVQRVERERHAGDRILLYTRSIFVWGYYQAREPVLSPVPGLANGYTVVVTDPDVSVVPGPDVDAAIARAFDAGGRVWFLGSRFRPGDEPRLRGALLRRGHIVAEDRRPLALLLALEPQPTASATHR